MRLGCSKIWPAQKRGNTINRALLTVSIHPSGRGERSIVFHIGCAETGLLEDCLLMFRGSKPNKSSDYHSEMNWDVFSHWCDSEVFPRIKCVGYKSCLLLDRAIYYTVLDEEDRRPVTSWSKTRVFDAIERWGDCEYAWTLTWKMKKTNNNNYLIMQETFTRAPIIRFKKIADLYEEGHFNIVVLFLAVARPELNPIEMV